MLKHASLKRRLLIGNQTSFMTKEFKVIYNRSRLRNKIAKNLENNIKTYPKIKGIDVSDSAKKL